MPTQPNPFSKVVPKGVLAPLAYSPGVVLHPQTRSVLVSGQVGVDAAGNIGTTFRQQSEVACQNVLAVLAAAEMTAENIAKTTVFLTSAEHVATWRAVRSEVLGDIQPASTLVIVSALADPRWQVEIEALAVAVCQ